MSTQRNINSHGIRDNHSRGKVADFLAEKMAAGSHLSVMSAYFTIYAYDALSSQLDQIDHLNFLFGEPRFIASLDPDKTDKKAFKIEDEGMELANRLQQKEVARRCAAWLRDKVDIYLAGRLACTPTANATALKLLVLDDVLIGLDHSNRLPMLDVLNTKFADWQIVLLTHDRNWFDLARSHLPEPGWKCVEVYEGDGAATAPIPIVRPTQNRPARALLEKAKELVQTPYVEAAANYARQAFELGARKACELKGIELRYLTDPKKYKSEEFLNKLKTWTVTGSVKQADWDAALARLETLKNVVMNPYSHPSAPNIPKQEVEQAIAAVDDFLKLAAKK